MFQRAGTSRHDPGLRVVRLPFPGWRQPKAFSTGDEEKHSTKRP